MKQLDLRKDFTDIYRFISERVRSFDPSTNDGPGNEKLVTRVDLGYQCDQAGWVALVFDTRPDAEPDGAWNSHIMGNWLERPGWLATAEANEEEPVQVVMPDGTERVIPPDSCDEFTRILGDLLKSVLLQARTDGVFERMAKAPRCELGVEEQDGDYGWPAYEERGQDNLA